MSRIGRVNDGTFPILSGTGGIGGSLPPATVGSFCDIGDVDCTGLAPGDVLVWDGSAWTPQPFSSTTPDLDAVLAVSGGQDIADALTGAAAPDAGNVFATMADVGGGGGGSDPIAAFFGTPDTAFEFDTSSFTGLTSIGTADAEDADTTVPDHYYVRIKRNANPYWCGRYAAVTAPFTAIVKLSAVSQFAASPAQGMFMAAATPVALDIMFYGVSGAGTYSNMNAQRWTNNGAFGAQLYNGAFAFVVPMYLGIKANSNTDVDFYASQTGDVWTRIITARNPGFTIGSVGPFISNQDGTNAASAAYDFLRIWNSAKTFVI